MMELCKEFTFEPINLDGLNTLHQYTPRVETNTLHVVFQNPIGNSVVFVNHSQLSLKVDICLCLEQTTHDTHTPPSFNSIPRCNGACTHVDTNSIGMACRSFSMRMVYFIGPSLFGTYGTVGLDRLNSQNVALV